MLERPWEHPSPWLRLAFLGRAVGTIDRSRFWLCLLALSTVHGRLRGCHSDRQHLGAHHLGLYWKPARRFVLTVALLTVVALWRYGADYELRKSAFLLKYLLESQAAFMWMSTFTCWRLRPISLRCLAA
ncbi:MAG: hypothetical protein IPL59_25285 [Candidatus Competibacteraceae bacterium]|nr:hypothetical protein [Candidatus Competibacteraceae bacterium]